MGFEGEVEERAPPHQMRNLVFLALAFGITFAAQSGHYTVAPLAAHVDLLVNKFPTLPNAVTDLGALAFSVPMATAMQRFGRVPGLLIGGFTGIIGAFVCGAGIQAGSFTLLCCGSFFFGCWQVCAQYIRFAAAESVSKRLKSKAISLVFVGSSVFGSLGPQLVHWFHYWPSQLDTYAGYYSAAAGLAVLFILVVLGVRMPPRASDNGGEEGEGNGEDGEKLEQDEGSGQGQQQEPVLQVQVRRTQHDQGPDGDVEQGETKNDISISSTSSTSSTNSSSNSSSSSEGGTGGGSGNGRKPPRRTRSHDSPRRFRKFRSGSSGSFDGFSPSSRADRISITQTLCEPYTITDSSTLPSTKLRWIDAQGMGIGSGGGGGASGVRGSRSVDAIAEEGLESSGSGSGRQEDLRALLLSPGGTSVSPTRPRPLCQILRSPVIVVSMLSAVTGMYVMTLVMSATSLSMHVLYKYDLFLTTSTVQLHIVCMFLPGIFTGYLMDTLGKVNTILIGLLIFVCSMLVGMMGTSVAHFMVTLALLGLGWNFTYLGGTRLLVEGYAENEAGLVEGVNEALVQAAGTIAAFGSGWLVGQFGWHTVLFAAWPLIILDIIAVLAFKAWRLVLIRHQNATGRT